ncbi:aminotransferase class IV [Pseudonocardia sp. GCM10023141]|uniref:aminotransferase class IV n=1 Tax=Pseudonocardia sp. GCM10023141 TaxID=3252653 RepID=UPI00361058D3
MSDEGVFVWDGAQLRPAPAGSEMLVADSWLVTDGAVGGFGHHRDRFTAACAAAGVPADRTTAFLDAVPALLPVAGRWFPRIECGPGAGGSGPGGPELRLRVRQAPPTTATLVLAPHPEPDPRRAPRTKGPDLVMLGEVRNQAIALGAGEAVLCAADGTLLEGAYSAVVWWRGEELCLPDPELPVLDSVTRRRVVEEAGRRGVAVRYERVTPAALDGLETWSLSALHGIRAVSGWRGCDVRAGAARRAPEWRAQLGADVTMLAPTTVSARGGVGR